MRTSKLLNNSQKWRERVFLSTPRQPSPFSSSQRINFRPFPQLPAHSFPIYPGGTHTATDRRTHKGQNQIRIVGKFGVQRVQQREVNTLQESASYSFVLQHESYVICHTRSAVQIAQMRSDSYISEKTAQSVKSRDVIQR